MRACGEGFPGAYTAFTHSRPRLVRFDPLWQRDPISVECADLVALLRSEPFHHGAFKARLAGADALASLTWGKGQTYASFIDRLVKDRARLDGHRAAEDAHGVAWRVQHPERRPGMSPDELDGWEAATGAVWLQS